jgi:hypothetical protein
MTNLNWTDSAVVGFLELDGAITHVFAYTQKGEHSITVGAAVAYHPSLSKLSRSPLGLRKRRNRILPGN